MKRRIGEEKVGQIDKGFFRDLKDMARTGLISKVLGSHWEILSRRPISSGLHFQKFSWTLRGSRPDFCSSSKER